MITRRRFFKKTGLLVATLLVAPKVLFQLKETPKFECNCHKGITPNRYDLRSEVLDGLGDWMCKERDKRIFEAINNGTGVLQLR